MEKLKENMTDFILGVVMLLISCYAVFAKSVVKGTTLLDTDVPLSDAKSFVRILGVVLMVLSVYIILRALGLFKRTDKGDLKFKKPESIVVIGFAILLAFLILTNVIGFTISSVLMIASITYLIMVKEKGIDRHDKKAVLKAVGISLLYSIILVFVLCFAFKNWLHVMLPQ